MEAYHSVEWYASRKTLVLADSQSFVFLAFSGGVVAQKLVIGRIVVSLMLQETLGHWPSDSLPTGAVQKRFKKLPSVRARPDLVSEPI